ncbi:MAG: SAM-dependent methyltransferase, partial [Candidatus Nanopelagicales bacterium]
DYLPQVQEGEHDLATLEHAVHGLGTMTRTVPLPVPADCADGVFAAYWRRPEMYLRADVRAAMSATALLPEPIVDDAVRRLANDLEDGTWDRKYGYLKELATLDLGYRLVVSDT